ncbi:hypothetical protein NPA09_02940 [Mycoplasmopsis equigenitalium]|uniref:DUF202 domain-containing protein n=1 Tax=Mycoplasmopsis equigenitalium TaxID=114883 RepID=A0ABY5J0T2_9BACT|nr:hypothetical protein [Mycoplasmopsis equigenitalium]UUD36829.1 hypothetical protein NPA09_02940 [Mycoplasmopsis equigenitalium]
MNTQNITYFLDTFMGHQIAPENETAVKVRLIIFSIFALLTIFFGTFAAIIRHKTRVGFEESKIFNKTTLIICIFLTIACAVIGVSSFFSVLGLVE